MGSGGRRVRDASSGGKGGGGAGGQVNSIIVFVIIKKYMKSKWPPIRDGPMHCLRADSIARTMVHCTAQIILVPYTTTIVFCKVITGDRTDSNG